MKTTDNKLKIKNKLKNSYSHLCNKGYKLSS